MALYQDSEYIGHGVTDIYMVCEPLAGKRYCLLEQNHNRFSWVKVLTQIIDTYYADCEKITLVHDNLSAHKPSACYQVYEPAKAYLDKIDFVFTPAHGSWLNMAEIELSVLQSDCLETHFASEQELKKTTNSLAKSAQWETGQSQLALHQY